MRYLATVLGSPLLNTMCVRLVLMRVRIRAPSPRSMSVNSAAASSPSSVRTSTKTVQCFNTDSFGVVSFGFGGLELEAGRSEVLLTSPGESDIF